jgi:hypothetical protein
MGGYAFANASRTMALSIVHRHLLQPSAADFGLIEIYGGQGRNLHPSARSARRGPRPNRRRQPFQVCGLFFEGLCPS